MRLFIEAVLESRALDDIWSVGERLRRQPTFPDHAVRWVKREAMHLTLRFLGEVDEDRLPDVSGALDELQDSGRFAVCAAEVGSFGGRRPRVVWVGFARDDGFERLRTLRQRLDGALTGAGFEMEAGEFRPHITLGRVRRQATAGDLAAIRSAVADAASLDITSAVERVALVESRLLRDGPQYRQRAITEL